MTAFPVTGSIRTVSHMVKSKCFITAKMMKEVRGPLVACENIIPVSSVTSPPLSPHQFHELQVRKENEVQQYADR